MPLLDRIHPDDRVLTCTQCGYKGTPDTSVKLNGNVKASCARCSKYIKFVRVLGEPIAVEVYDGWTDEDIEHSRFYETEDPLD